jgi:hypothetical protein
VRLAHQPAGEGLPRRCVVSHHTLIEVALRVACSEASLFEQRLSKPAENAADPAACGRISEREKSDAHVAVRHRSAVRIQSRWRGVQARQKYWIQLEDEAERLEREMTTVKAGVASAAAPRAPHGEGEGRPVGAAGNAELLHGSELSQPVERPTEADRKDLSPDIQCTFGNAGSLGIGFGCQGVKGPVYITKIKDGSAAAQQPQLRPGLVLTAVQVCRSIIAVCRSIRHHVFPMHVM